MAADIIMQIPYGKIPARWLHINDVALYLSRSLSPYYRITESGERGVRGKGDDGFFVDDTGKHYEAPVCQANIKG